jgi:hypothetical protein
MVDYAMPLVFKLRMYQCRCLILEICRVMRHFASCEPLLVYSAYVSPCSENFTAEIVGRDKAFGSIYSTQQSPQASTCRTRKFLAMDDTHGAILRSSAGDTPK